MAGRRVEYSASERSELWERWRAGETLSDVARALDRAPGTISATLTRHGGIAPPERRRSPRALSLAEREEISRGVAAGRPARRIAADLSRAPSTVTREINRHGGRGDYRAQEADTQALESLRRPQVCKLAKSPALCQLVAAKLRRDWSPEQIAGWLKFEFEGDQTMQVSHETIYLSLFIQARGALKKELIAHLRRARAYRRPRPAKSPDRGQGQITGAISIRERPAEAEDRAVPGHWEGDLIAGSNNSHVATLVERHSRFVMLVEVAGKDSISVTTALAESMGRLPKELKASLTWDRGTEMAAHAKFTLATDLKVYFCDPQSPWQRGSNENTNGLLRQYLPKKTDLSVYNQEELDEIAIKLNTRPRETLGYKTPAATLEAVLR